MKLITAVSIVFLLIFLVLSPSRPVSALSNNLLIYQVQTGVSGGLSQELIVLINSSSEDLQITNYCLFYSSYSDLTVKNLPCVDSTDTNTELWLEAGGLLTFATGEFVFANPGFVPDFSLESSLASAGGHVWIEDAAGSTVDKLGWGSATNPEGDAASLPLAGQLLSRNLVELPVDTDDNKLDFSSQGLLEVIVSGVYEKDAIIDFCRNIDGIQNEAPIGYMQDELGGCYKDVCPNLDELQITVPDGYEKVLGITDCTKIILENSALLITEIKPNAPSSDTGQEFIELYNPNSFDVNLKGYKIQVGPNYTKQFEFSDGIIKAGKFRVFSDTITGIVLPNSTGVSLRLITPAGETVSQTAVYANAGDDVSWALVNDQWIYTNQQTPETLNQPYLEPTVDEVINETTVYAPCTAGKYRSPETNRCRSIETATSVLTACKADEFRNPETNRCKKIAAVSTLADCPVGQERNPETNRCRKVSVLAASTNDIPIVEDIKVAQSEGQINWFMIITVLLGTFSYIAYEWRSELAHSYGRMRTKLVQ